MPQVALEELPGRFDALERKVDMLIETWQHSMMPALSKQTAAVDDLRGEIRTVFKEIHEQGRTIDALKKTDADLATAQDSTRNLLGERVARLEASANKAMDHITKLMEHVDRLLNLKAPMRKKAKKR